MGTCSEQAPPGPALRPQVEKKICFVLVFLYTLASGKNAEEKNVQGMVERFDNILGGSIFVILQH